MKILTIKGKQYYVGNIIPAGDHGIFVLHTSFAPYRSYRDGKPYGTSRKASEKSRPGTVGRAIWDAVNQV